LLTCCSTAPAGHRRVAGPDDGLNTRATFILSWQPRHGSVAAPKLNGVTADKARLLILLA
jgi:hypothetical protein